MKCLNVRGLALTSSKAKVNIIEDSLEMDNSIGIFLTETWLDESIYDAEIQMNNFNIHRSDRKSRQRGGAAIYLRKELNSKTFSIFSNMTHIKPFLDFYFCQTMYLSNIAIVAI